MSKYVKADWLYNELGGTNMDIYTDEVKEYIDSAPAIDLVRCAECKKVREDGGHANCGGYLYCRKWKTLVDEDCFCSWGEREGK